MRIFVKQTKIIFIMKVTIKQNEASKSFKDVYLNGNFIGSVISDGKSTALECYESLKNNWEIDYMEAKNDAMIDFNSTY